MRCVLFLFLGIIVSSCIVSRDQIYVRNKLKGPIYVSLSTDSVFLDASDLYRYNNGTHAHDDFVGYDVWKKHVWITRDMKKKNGVRNYGVVFLPDSVVKEVWPGESAKVLEEVYFRGDYDARSRLNKLTITYGDKIKSIDQPYQSPYLIKKRPLLFSNKYFFYVLIVNKRLFKARF